MELNSQMISSDSPLTKRGEVIATEFETKYQVQGRTAKISHLSAGNLVQISGTADALGAIAVGTHAVVTANISPGTGFAGQVLAGWCIEEIYEGTQVVGSMLLYPAAGAGIAPDKFRTKSGYRHLLADDIGHHYQVEVYNNSGTVADIYAVARWKYVMNGGGTQG